MSGDGIAALAGGAFFGFGSYEVVQVLAGHPNLGLVFVVPLCAYLVVRRLDGSVGRVAFVLLLGVALAAQFGISTEIFATMTVVGALAGAIGLLLATKAVRGALVRIGPFILGAYALAAVLVSPALYAAAHFPRPVKPPTLGPGAATWSGAGVRDAR